VVGALALVLAACGGNDGPSGTQSGTTAGSSESGSATGEGDGDVVALTFWGKSQGQSAQVDLWNETHPDVQVTYVEQGGDADLLTAIQNSIKGGNAPDLSELPRTNAVSLVVEGATQDISEWFTDTSAFSPGAAEFVQVGGVTVGVPYATNPTFNAVNTTTFERFGLEPADTWPEVIEQAKTMAAEGVKSFNLPGEDASYLRDFATQLGAEWWSAEGDGWRIGFTSEESLAAADLLQEIIDNDLNSTHTYIEWDALMQFFASGDLSQFTTSTWQLPVYEENFASSVGDWKLYPYPKASADAELVSPSYYNILGIMSTSEHPAQAVEFATWLATDPAALAISASPTEGSASFPVVTDPSPYIDQLLPVNLLGDTRADAPAVVIEAAATARSMKEGPNQAAADGELAGWWGKAVAKQVTVREVLEHMQQWVVDDLTAKNINVVE